MRLLWRAGWMAACALWLLGSAGAEDAAVRLALREQAAASGPSILLGEVARIEGGTEALQSVDLGPAPLPGRTRSLSVGAIKLRLRRYGFDPQEMEFTGAAEVTVARAPAVQRRGRTAARRPEASVPPETGVRRRDRVRVIVEQGAVRISVPAEALAEAGVGEVVKVRLLTNNLVVQGWVERPGIVRLGP